MSDLIDRQAAITLPVMPKEHRKYQTHNLDDAYEQGWFDLQECIENLPSVQPEPLTLRVNHELTKEEYDKLMQDIKDAPIVLMPSVQPDIIRCKDCRWWDKYGDYDNGYCMAAKHGYWSEHWDISIRRTYKGDFYCADAEPKGEFDDEAEEEDEGEQ